MTSMHLSRRSLLAGAAATAAFSIIGLPRKSAATETPLEILTGPVLSVGNPPSTYDTWQLTQVQKTVNGFKSDPLALVTTVAKSTTMMWNYYDLALSCYLLYYRTGDTAWRDAARTVAVAWRNNDLNSNTIISVDGGIALYLAGQYWLNPPTNTIGRQVPPPRDFSTLGIAIHAVETGDTASRSIVNEQALLGERNWAQFIDGSVNDGMRESAYSLMAMLSSTLLGDDHRATALVSLNGFLAGQKSDGRWEDTDTGAQVPALHFTQAFMMGLVMESLIMYDRVIGDPRIIPALTAATAYLWNTLWVPVVPNSSPPFGAFQYANINSGTVNTNPYANLSGLIVPAWGYLYAKTGNTVYKTQGDAALSGMVAGGAQAAIPGSGIYDSKQSNQEFRSSPRYLGWTGGSSGALSAPFNLLVK
jgi:hypothetical protein